MTQPTAGPKGRQNGFILFGDGSQKNRLVQCGVVRRQKKATITEGSGKNAPRAEVAVEVDATVEMEITVDPAAGDVSLTVNGKTAELSLSRKFRNISHVGFGVQNATTRFQPLNVTVAK